MPDKKSKNRGKPKRKFPKGSQREGFVQISPAINITMHDLGGMGISDKIAKEALDAVTEVAVQYGYVINYART